MSMGLTGTESLEDLQLIGKLRGYHANWAYHTHVAQQKKRKPADNQNPVHNLANRMHLAGANIAEISQRVGASPQSVMCMLNLEPVNA